MPKYIVVDGDEGKLYFDYNNPDRLHRIGGPAAEYPSGTKFWYFHGNRHRLDGPAVEWYGGEFKEWWVYGKRLTEKEFNDRYNSCSGKIAEIDGKKYKLTPIVRSSQYSEVSITIHNIPVHAIVRELSNRNYYMFKGECYDWL